MRAALDQEQHAGIDKTKFFEQREKVVAECPRHILLTMGQNFEIKDSVMDRYDDGKPVVEKNEAMRLFFTRLLVQLEIERQHFQRSRMDGNFDIKIGQSFKSREKLE